MSDRAWCDLAPAFALGALDPEDERGFAEHLETCAACRVELAEHRSTVAALAEGIPAIDPPPALKDRVLEAARTSEADRPESDEPRGGADPGVRDIRSAKGPAPPGPLSRAMPWLAAASVAFAIWAGLSGLRASRAAEETTADLADARDRIAALEADRAIRDSMLAALAGPAVETATLTDAASQPQVRLFRNRELGRLLVTAFGLPPAGAGRTYQLWGIAPDTEPVSLGTFDTGPDGRAVLLRPLAEAAAFTLGAVTEEPEGGSPQPTSRPFLVGNWATATP